MLKLGVIIALIGTGLGVSMFYPLLLPPDMLILLKVLLVNLWSMNGLLPIQAIFYSVYFLVQIVVYWFAFKLIMSLLGSNTSLDS